MTDKERMAAILTATPDVLRRVDEVLEGRESNPRDDCEDGQLVSITNACKRTGQNYSWVYRRIQDGVLDVIDVSGRRLITKRSLDELLQGKRQPSEEAVKRRAERNAARRAEYERRKGTRPVTRRQPASVAASQSSPAALA